MRIHINRPVCAILLALLALAAPAWATEHRAMVGPGHGTLLSDPATDRCGSLLMNGDQSYEDGIAWREDALQPPYSGSFAECYSGPGEICAVVLDLTTTPEVPEPPPDVLLDVLVWEDGGGNPGNVMCLVTGVDPWPVAVWPQVSRHEVEMSPACCAGPSWWVGYWSDWPYDPSPVFWYVGVDEDGPEGCPRTLVRPGLGWPSGWQDVNVVFGQASALGIGARVRPCSATPVFPGSWGRIKGLYRM